MNKSHFLYQMFAFILTKNINLFYFDFFYKYAENSVNVNDQLKSQHTDTTKIGMLQSRLYPLTVVRNVWYGLMKYCYLMTAEKPLSLVIG